MSSQEPEVGASCCLCLFRNLSQVLGTSGFREEGSARPRLAEGSRGATGVQDEWGVAATSWLLLELQGWVEQSSTRVEGGGPFRSLGPGGAE